MKPLSDWTYTCSGIMNFKSMDCPIIKQVKERNPELYRQLQSMPIYETHEVHSIDEKRVHGVYFQRRTR